MTDLLISISGPSQERPPHPPGTVAWLEDFAARVRNVDFERARRLFSPTIFGFGTKADAYDSLDEWHHDQWSHVWPRTTGFRFDLMTLRTILSVDGSLCCIACEWGSKGAREDGSLFQRHGRSSILLARTSSNELGWVGVHSHFSMPPGPVDS
ncbi:MAG: nuclear transport factor 2 family protein [Gammaproteobacteria bacterium]|nr:nuclear transport factor 2 family protein [Gammaproteobacteria bacterium]